MTKIRSTKIEWVVSDESNRFLDFIHVTDFRIKDRNNDNDVIQCQGSWLVSVR